MTIAEKALLSTARAIVRLFGQTEDERLQAIDARLSRRDRMRDMAIRVLCWPTRDGGAK